jgi:hypothetical protein
MDYNKLIKEIARRNGAKASAVLMVTSVLFVGKLYLTNPDGTPQSALITALLAFIAGAALATSMRWNIVANVIRR